MTDTHILRQNAIVRNATVGASPPHGPVKTGELPHVHVKQPPGGPQIQEGQQKPVTIMPSKDPQGAVAAGSLPQVQIKMTQNGPQPDDGRDNPVVIKNNRQTVAAGNLPMIEVKMDNGRPQLQTDPNVSAAPPQIPSGAPALSAPRGVASTQVAPRVARIAAPVTVPLPEVPEFTAEELLLCRHQVDKFLVELRALSSSQDGEETLDVEASETGKLAVATLAKIDDALVAITVRAEAVAQGAVLPSMRGSVPAPPSGYVAPRPVTGGHVSPAALAPTIPAHHGYVAQRPGTRSHVTGGRMQAASPLAPRRVQRQASGEPLPPVIVKMDGQRPVVQQSPVVPVAAVASNVSADPARVD